MDATTGPSLLQRILAQAGNARRGGASLHPPFINGEKNVLLKLQETKNINRELAEVY